MTLQYEHLVGIEYKPGVRHCYSLVQDLYRDNFGMVLPDVAIPTDWNAETIDLIEMAYRTTGFSKVEGWSIRDLRPGDVLCLAVRSSNANHLAVYVGGNTFIHHPFGRMSCIEPMRDFWRMCTTSVMRHPDTPDLTPQLPTADIMDLIRERYRPQTEA